MLSLHRNQHETPHNLQSLRMMKTPHTSYLLSKLPCAKLNHLLKHCMCGFQHIIFSICHIVSPLLTWVHLYKNLYLVSLLLARNQQLTLQLQLTFSNLLFAKMLTEFAITTFPFSYFITSIFIYHFLLCLDNEFVTFFIVILKAEKSSDKYNSLILSKSGKLMVAFQVISA